MKRTPDNRKHFLPVSPRMFDEPAFFLGQLVRVVLNERNKTPHTGTICEIIWHYKDQRYNYYLEEDGKKVSKRCFKDDLEALPGAS